MARIIAHEDSVAAVFESGEVIKIVFTLRAASGETHQFWFNTSNNYFIELKAVKTYIAPVQVSWHDTVNGKWSIIGIEWKENK